jgi:hypothetical protein
MKMLKEKVRFAVKLLPGNPGPWSRNAEVQAEVSFTSQLALRKEQTVSFKAAHIRD